MKTIVFTIFLVTLLSCMTAQTALSASRDAEADPTDHLALATLMLYDGRYEKARDELKLLDTHKKDFDSARYFTIEGLVAARLEDYKAAIGYYRKAIQATREKKYRAVKGVDIEALRAEKIGQLYLQLADAQYRLKEYSEVIQALDSAGPIGVARPELFSLRADCYWKLENPSSAMSALDTGLAHFPKERSFIKQKFYYFAELGLYQAAVDTADLYLQKGGAKVEDYLAFAQALSGARQDRKAIALLEKARLEYPDKPKLAVLLGHLYLRQDMPNAAAVLFEVASVYDRKYIAEAAEVYRRAKDFPASLRLNAQISDPKEKLKQQVAIFVDQGEFERILGLKDPLERHQMLSDEGLRYAMAYAYFMVKDYGQAEAQLKKLTKSELFAKATVIRKQIARCKQNELECI